jgi:hypothetical protein
MICYFESGTKYVTVNRHIIYCDHKALQMMSHRNHAIKEHEKMYDRFMRTEQTETAARTNQTVPVARDSNV